MATHTVEDGGTEAVFEEDHEPNFSFCLPSDETIDVKLVFEVWENNDTDLDKLVGEAEVEVKDLIVSEDFLEHVLELHLPAELQLQNAGSTKAIQILETNKRPSLRRESSADVMHPPRGYLVIDACERMAPVEDGDEKAYEAPKRQRTPRSARRETALARKEMEKDMKASAVRSARAAAAETEAKLAAKNNETDGKDGDQGDNNSTEGEAPGEERKLPTDDLIRNLRAIEVQFEKGDLGEAMEAVANVESHIQYELQQDPYAPVPTDGALYHACYFIIKLSWFEPLITCCILLNTILMCVEHFEQPYLLTLILFYFNVTLSIIFALEMALKLGGVGINGYTSDPVNTFDGLIVITSMADILISPTPGAGSGVSALRAFRLLRVFRLVRSWKSLNRLLTIMANAFFEVFPFMLVLFLCIFIFSLVGMQFFGGFWIDEEGEVVSGVRSTILCIPAIHKLNECATNVSTATLQL